MRSQNLFHEQDWRRQKVIPAKRYLTKYTLLFLGFYLSFKWFGGKIIWEAAARLSVCCSSNILHFVPQIESFVEPCGKYAGRKRWGGGKGGIRVEQMRIEEKHWSVITRSLLQMCSSQEKKVKGVKKESKGISGNLLDLEYPCSCWKSLFWPIWTK